MEKITLASAKTTTGRTQAYRMPSGLRDATLVIRGTVGTSTAGQLEVSADGTNWVVQRDPYDETVAITTSVIPCAYTIQADGWVSFNLTAGTGFSLTFELIINPTGNELIAGALV